MKIDAAFFRAAWLERLDEALAFVAGNADRADRSNTGLTAEIARLREAGLLAACLPPAHGGIGLGMGDSNRTTRLAVDVLRRLGRANLSVARLIEGHLNAVKLIVLYAEPALAHGIFAEVAEGALLGVWAADSEPRLVAEGSGDVLALAGAKRFASGLGLVSYALVALDEGGEQRLAVVEVDDAGRQDAPAWNAAGMRATLSGRFDFTGMAIHRRHLVGGPGDYRREPHFEGGVWRYCAAHVGGAQALIETWRALAEGRGALDEPLQLARLGRAVALADAAAATVEKCAIEVEAAAGDADAIERAVARALLARQFVEEACVEIMALAERSLGTQAHDRHSTVERQRRDLSLFLRQAALDAKLLKAAGDLRRGPLW